MLLVTAFTSWVYKLFLLVDGNFKADHVRQTTNNDIWLMDGSGMFPNRQEYFTFLADAIEKLTVCGRCRVRFRSLPG